MKLFDRMQQQRARYAFWAVVPIAARLTLLAAVFCSFAVVGFVNDIFSAGMEPRVNLVAYVLLSGVVAVGYAVCAFGAIRWIGVVVGAHLTATILFHQWLPPAPPIPAIVGGDLWHGIQARLTLDGTGCFAGVVAGYVLFVIFISTEGQRSFRVHAEMQLAERIHRSLVPGVSGLIDGFEVLGLSVPAGKVGGDLVDVVSLGPKRSIAYAADVAGHGVASGVVTGMVKSAVRIRLRAPAPLATLLEDLNEALASLVEGNMFVTAAFLELSDKTVTLAAAGHPPLLHYRRASHEVVEHNTSNVALGLFADQSYTTAAVAVARGDVLLVLTDGLTEVFDAGDAEFGIGGVREALLAHAETPLATIADAIRTAALGHGPQRDDQTLLLLRAIDRP